MLLCFPKVCKHQPPFPLRNTVGNALSCASKLYVTVTVRAFDNHIMLGLPRVSVFSVIERPSHHGAGSHPPFVAHMCGDALLNSAR